MWFNQKKNNVAVATLAPKPVTPLKRRSGQVRAKGYLKTAALLEFGTRFTGAEDKTALMEETLRAAVRDTGSDLGYVMLLDESTGILQTELAISLGRQHSIPESLELGAGVEGVTVAEGTQILLSRRMSALRKDQHQSITFDGESVLSTPLVRIQANGSSSEACGVIVLVSYHPRHVYQSRDQELAQSLAALMVVTLVNERRHRQLRHSFLMSLSAMARAAEAKVPFMEGHGDRVALVCRSIGEQLGIDADVLEDLRYGALLHEIGKIGVPDTILLKPGQLTPEEFATLKQYPVIGYDICKPLGLGEQVLMLVRNHPERLDGTGYPDKLKYGELPLPLRILCVSDAFDAMSSYRPYRNFIDSATRHEQLNRFAGTQFDPIVVEALKGLLADGKLESLYQEHWEKYSQKQSAAPAAESAATEEAPAQPVAAPTGPTLYLADVADASTLSEPVEEVASTGGLSGGGVTSLTGRRADSKRRASVDRAPISDVKPAWSSAAQIQPSTEEGASGLEISGAPSLANANAAQAPELSGPSLNDMYSAGETSEELQFTIRDPERPAVMMGGTDSVDEPASPVFSTSNNLSLEEAAMEAAAFAAEALEAATREQSARDKAA